MGPDGLEHRRGVAVQIGDGEDLGPRKETVRPSRGGRW